MSSVQYLEKAFPHEPTPQQAELFLKLHSFLLNQSGYACFILKGYAGTGKTTIVSALVKALKNYGLKSVLLAPTGRAAKVISSYSGKKAFTIHKKIYRKRQAMGMDTGFANAQNLAEDTIFVVDEASMISDEGTGFTRDTLLADLVQYVYNDKNCKLLLVGDTAQLPPVGSEFSPALDMKLMTDNFGLQVATYELTDVLRQQKESGILFNVTGIRDIIREGEEYAPQMITKGYKDVYRMSGERLQEGLEYTYKKYGYENTLIVCRSNKNANMYNQQIRSRLLYREEELTGGDRVMVVKNNYFWLQGGEADSTDFIANGDMGVITRVRRTDEMYGHRFADVLLQLSDHAEEKTIECKVMLDTLTSETPAMSSALQKEFYTEVMKDYQHIPNRRQQMNELKLNPYYNALQIKFSYAVTCHKAQGGQWDAVFVDQGYLTDEMLNTDFLRWLYTACTRARQELFLVNFGQQFFEASAE